MLTLEKSVTKQHSLVIPTFQNWRPSPVGAPRFGFTSHFTNNTRNLNSRRLMTGLLPSPDSSSDLSELSKPTEDMESSKVLSSAEVYYGNEMSA